MPFASVRSASILALPLVLGGLATARDAAAAGWQESHRSADDVRIEVGEDGVARVHHHLRYRVVAGRLKSFELTGVDASATLESEAAVAVETPPEVRPTYRRTPEPPAAPSAHVERSPKTPGAIRVTIDDPKGLPRGTYTIDVAYALDLVQTKAIVKDGAMWRLSWTAPVAPEGMDGARVTFDLPAAPTPPSLANTEANATTIATVRQDRGRDELELVRAHVPRGEIVTWSVRVDPKAFPAITAPELRAPEPPAEKPRAVQTPKAAILSALGLVIVAAALALVRRQKQRHVARICAARGVLPRPLVPVPARFAPVAYGLAATLALATFLWGSPEIGSVLLASAMALGAFRPPRVLPRPRGPGRWTESDDLFARAGGEAADPGDALDLGTGRGRLVFGAVVLGVAAIAYALREHVPYAHVAIPLAATAIVPVFATGIRLQLPPTPIDLASRVLLPARDALAAKVDLAHVDLVPLARLREGTRAIDEVRLACAPAIRIPGLRTIELALAASPEAPDAPIPEVLVRFDDGSAAAAKVAAIAPGMEIVVGRTPEEKVLRVAPRVPTPRRTADLVARLLRELEGRRAVDRDEPPAPFRGDERRGKRPSRAPRAAAAAA